MFFMSIKENIKIALYSSTVISELRIKLLDDDFVTGSMQLLDCSH